MNKKKAGGFYLTAAAAIACGVFVCGHKTYMQHTLLNWIVFTAKEMKVFLSLLVDNGC